MNCSRCEQRISNHLPIHSPIPDLDLSGLCAVCARAHVVSRWKDSFLKQNLNSLLSHDYSAIEGALDEAMGQLYFGLGPEYEKSFKLGELELRAYLAEQASDFEKASRFWQAIVALQPGSSLLTTAHSTIGRLQLAQGDLNGAIQTYTSTLQTLSESAPRECLSLIRGILTQQQITPVYPPSLMATIKKSCDVIRFRLDLESNHGPPMSGDDADLLRWVESISLMPK